MAEKDRFPLSKALRRPKKSSPGLGAGRSTAKSGYLDISVGTRAPRIIALVTPPNRRWRSREWL